MPKKQVSIRDVASACGVSVATVSRIINNQGKCSKETELLVREKIRELGYASGRNPKPSRKTSTRAVGILVPDIRYEFFGNLIALIEQKLYAYDLAAFACNMIEEREALYLDRIASLNLTGLVVVSGYRKKGYQLPDSVPAVYINCIPDEGQADSRVATVESNNVDAGYLAATQLIASGSRHICIVTSRINLDKTPYGRTIGYLKAMWEYGLNCDDSYVITVDSAAYQDGYEATKRLLAAHPGVDGIFCTSDALALGAMHCLRDHGMRVPQDVRIVGCNDTSIAQVHHIATIRHPLEEMAELVVDFLIKMEADKPLTQRHVVLPVSFVPNDTCPVP